MNMLEILAAVAAKTLSEEQALVLLETKSTTTGKSTFTLKVSQKGCVQVRGIRGIHRTFGLSLYVEAMEDLFAHREEIEAFIKANANTLKRKVREDKKAA